MKTLKCDLCEVTAEGETFEEWMKALMPHYMEAHADVMKNHSEDAISRWQNAPDTEKSAKAQNVLMHIGSHPGIKLADFTDTKTVSQIKADFASKNE